ncbi:mCG145199, partial [Mus musculus]
NPHDFSHIPTQAAEQLGPFSSTCGCVSVISVRHATGLYLRAPPQLMMGCGRRLAGHGRARSLHPHPHPQRAPFLSSGGDILSSAFRGIL